MSIPEEKQRANTVYAIGQVTSVDCLTADMTTVLTGPPLSATSRN